MSRISELASDDRGTDEVATGQDGGGGMLGRGWVSSLAQMIVPRTVKTEKAEWAIPRRLSMCHSRRTDNRPHGKATASFP
ncbi:MAG: hypothetical protein U0792_21425 [Gemmataceae bacterium]